jgi:hypothetical protein
LRLVETGDPATRVWFQQLTTDGREVFGAELGVFLDDQGRVLAATGPVVPGLQVAAAPEAVDQEAAPDIAAESVGEEAEGDLTPLPSTEPGVAAYENDYADANADPAPVTVQEVVFPIAGSRNARAAWLTDVQGDEGWFDSVVDAATGEILYRDNRIKEEAQGLVYREQHPGIPGAAQQLTSFAGAPFDDAGWVSGTTTAGNNAMACRDVDGNNVCDHQPTTPASQLFDYPYTDAIATSSGADTTTDRDAVLTQGFYYVNMLHDLWYGYGFDEATRNFQTDNFGRGGAAGDAMRVLVDVDLVDACCNAFYAHADDGTAPTLVFYIGKPPDNRWMHRAMNGDTVAHEFGHGVSGRIVGGGSLGDGVQTDGLAEGWSDVQAFAVWNDPVYGEYNMPVGPAPTGIRRVAYDTSEWTYGDLCNSGCESHDDGEIWATAMWDVRVALITKHGAAEGADRFNRLLIAGMKATGTQPDFLDARDGFLLADQQLYADEDLCAIWGAFASNGMGVNASSASQSSVTENFEAPAACAPTADAGGGAGGSYAVAEGGSVVLDASASTPGDGSTLTFAWDLDGDGQFDDATGATPTFSGLGDDAAALIAVRVTNGSGLTADDTAVVVASNVVPTLSIAGPTLVVGQAGQPLNLAALVTDPGSDDLTVRFTWGDGTPDTVNVHLVNPPVADPPDSPTLQPRNVTSTAAHTFGSACASTVHVGATDDDGGASTTGTVTVVNLGTTRENLSADGWYNRIRLGKGATEDARIACYLQSIGLLSQVFDEARNASTKAAAQAVLTGTSTDRDRLDRALLTAWLNLVHGGVGYGQLIDADCDGVVETPYAVALATAEAVRLNPASTPAQLRAQREAFERTSLACRAVRWFP